MANTLSTTVEIIRSLLDVPITPSDLSFAREGFTIRGQVDGYSIKIENEDPATWYVNIPTASPMTIRKIQKCSECSFNYEIKDSNKKVIIRGQFPREICKDLKLYDDEDEEEEARRLGLPVPYTAGIGGSR